jgi:hypothetical protein
MTMPIHVDSLIVMYEIGAILAVVIAIAVLFTWWFDRE